MTSLHASVGFPGKDPAHHVVRDPQTPGDRSLGFSLSQGSNLSDRDFVQAPVLRTVGIVESCGYGVGHVLYHGDNFKVFDPVIRFLSVPMVHGEALGDIAPESEPDHSVGQTSEGARRGAKSDSVVERLTTWRADGFKGSGPPFCFFVESLPFDCAVFGDTETAFGYGLKNIGIGGVFHRPAVYHKGMD